MNSIIFFGIWFRLSCVEELARATIKKLTQGMVEHNTALAAAKSDEEKEKIVSALPGSIKC